MQARRSHPPGRRFFAYRWGWREQSEPPGRRYWLALGSERASGVGRV